LPVAEPLGDRKRGLETMGLMLQKTNDRCLPCVKFRKPDGEAGPLRLLIGLDSKELMQQPIGTMTGRSLVKERHRDSSSASVPTARGESGRNKMIG
jgi:hypothetical protein